MSAPTPASPQREESGPLAATFGAFEPRFYGVSFLLGTPATANAWLARIGIFPEATRPQLTVFEATCLMTAIEHEKRHFHDFLVSPFANRIFMLRLMAAFNGLKMLNRGARSGANCIPIPIKAWMRMTEEQRVDCLATASEDLGIGPLRPVPLPFAEGDPLRGATTGVFHADDSDLVTELHQFANAAAGAYIKIADLMRGPAAVLRSDPAFESVPDDVKRDLEATMTPRNIFEASALAIQLQAAWTNIGKEASDAFGEFLWTSETGYARLFRRMARSAAPPDDPGMVDPTRISAVALWCMLGDAATQDPTLRFSDLHAFLRQSGGIRAHAPVAELWDEWDSELDSKSWRESVVEMRERTARSLLRYSEIASQAGETAAGAFVAVLEAYVTDQRVATDLLLTDPDAYANPLRYIQETQFSLATPLMNCELGDDFVMPLEKIPVADAVRLPRVFDKDGVKGWNRCVLDMHAPPRPELLDAVLELEQACKVCDFAFSDEALTALDTAAMSKALGERSGMTPLFVF